MPLKKKWNAVLNTFPWKRKGYQVLERYDSARPADGDHAVLAQMAAHGVDFSRDRHVVHYLYFSDDDGRTTAETTLQENRYVTRHGADASDDKPKSLIAERTGLVNEKIIAEERLLLSDIAEDNRGDYDGWEAALD